MTRWCWNYYYNHFKTKRQKFWANQSHNRQAGQKGMEGAMEGGRKRKRKEEMGFSKRRNEWRGKNETVCVDIKYCLDKSLLIFSF